MSAGTPTDHLLVIATLLSDTSWTSNGGSPATPAGGGGTDEDAGPPGFAPLDETAAAPSPQARAFLADMIARSREAAGSQPLRETSRVQDEAPAEDRFPRYKDAYEQWRAWTREAQQRRRLSQPDPDPPPRRPPGLEGYLLGRLRGDLIEAVRQGLGLSRGRLARRAGLARATLRRLEGLPLEGNYCRVRSAHKVARALGVPLQLLLLTPEEMAACCGANDWAPTGDLGHLTWEALTDHMAARLRRAGCGEGAPFVAGIVAGVATANEPVALRLARRARRPEALAAALGRV